MKLNKILNLLRNSKQLFKSMWNEGVPAIRIVNESHWRNIIGESKDNGRGGKDKRITKKPVDIYEEIISEVPKINLKDLDRQIKLVKERKDELSKHMRHQDFNHENMALMFLDARKKYLKHKDKFKWPVTNKDLIDKLCKKYKVKMEGLHNYYRLVPKEGVEEIKKFGDALGYVSKADAIFMLIISDEERPKDPILLAQSPFGSWYYILGAWDKEVEIVDKLIYEGK